MRRADARCCSPGSTPLRSEGWVRGAELAGPDGFFLESVKHALDERFAIRVPMGSPRQCQVQCRCDVAVVNGRDLGAIVVADGVFQLVLASAVEECSRPGHPPGRRHVRDPAAIGEQPSQQYPVVGPDARGEVVPPVLPAPNAGHVGPPQLVARGDGERLALGSRRCLLPGLQESLGRSSRTIFLRFSMQPARRARAVALAISGCRIASRQHLVLNTFRESKPRRTLRYRPKSRIGQRR